MTEDNLLERLGEAEYSIRSLLEWSLGFEGDPLCVLIDELQFLLGSPFVVVKISGTERKNVLDWEKEEIIKSVPGDSPQSETKNVNNVLVSSITFMRRTGESPMLSRTILHSISQLYTYRFEGNDTEIQFGFASLSDSLKLFLTDNEFICFLKRTVSQVANHAVKGNGLDIGDFNIDTVHNRFRQSRYLEAALGWMHRKIVEVISSMGPEFQRDADSPFFINYFLSTTDTVAPPHSLRFFPLRDQIEILRSQRVKNAVEQKAAKIGIDIPKDILRFIRDYTWDSQRSFAGYVSDTGAAIYAERWHDEPLVRGDRLSEDEQRARRLAMVILQAAREWPSNLFEIPLMVGPHLFGVAHINVKQEIDEVRRILPIRSLRDSGFLLRIALRSDEEANHVASLSAYKHCMQSIMHHEGKYTEFLGRFVEDLAALNLPAPWPSDATLFSAIVRERQQVCDEFHQQADPLINVPAATIYRNNTTTGDIKVMIDLIQRLYPAKIPGQIILEIEASVPETIKAFNGQVLYRILREMLWNSFNRGRHVPSSKIKVAISPEDHGFLKIIVEDNLGGFVDDEEMPSAITFESWSEYVHRRELTHGMGFFTLARYAKSTRGVCLRENWTATNGRMGARVTVRLGLEREL